MIAQILTAVRRPICPTFIHDDQSRIYIEIVGIAVFGYILYRTMKYFNS